MHLRQPRFCGKIFAVMKKIISALIVGTLLFFAVPLRAATVMVFAAASLTESLQEIAAAYEKQSGDKIVFNFAASGTLARQIEEGAPADIFISADEAKADALEKKGLLVKETRKSLLGNSLVIVTPPDSTAIQSPADLTNAAVKRVALGEVRLFPPELTPKLISKNPGCGRRSNPRWFPAKTFAPCSPPWNPATWMPAWFTKRMPRFPKK